MTNQFKVEVSHAGSMTVNFADVLYVPVRTKEELWQVLQTLASPDYTDGFRHLFNHFDLPQEVRSQDDKAILHAWLLCNTVTRSKRYKKKKPEGGFSLDVLGLKK